MEQTRLFGIYPFRSTFRRGHHAVARIVTARKALWKGLGSAALALALAACAATPHVEYPPDQPYGQPQRPAPQARVEPQQAWPERPEYFAPQHMAGITPTRVALLLPLGAQDAGTRKVAESLRDAAQLALFEVERPELLLILKDTKGTAEGARIAARQALDQGAELILGPLFASSVRAVAPLALERNVAVVAFSSDRQAAEEGVFLLSFQVEEEIRRVVEFAARQNLQNFAALVPRNPYGERVATALRSQVYGYGGDIKHLVAYEPWTDDFRDPVRQIAEYSERKSALDAQKQELAHRTDEIAKRALSRLQKSDTWGMVSYEAVLLPEGGTKLRSLAPMLPYFDIDNRSVRFLGTGLWDDPSLWKEQSLQGGWFAAPPPEVWTSFVRLFDSHFSYQPPRIASLAYDGVTLAAALADGRAGERFTKERLLNRNGFAGVDGIFRFTEAGATERGLAVLEVKDGTVEVVGDAPAYFDATRDFWTSDPRQDDPYGTGPAGGPARDPFARDPYSTEPDESDPYRTDEHADSEEELTGY